MALRNPFKSKGDEKIVEEIEALRLEQRAFLRENARLREDAHAGVDVSIEAAQERFGYLAGARRLAFGADPLLGRDMDELAAAWAAGHPDFAKALHASVDGPAPVGSPDFSALTRKEFEDEAERFKREIASRELELERRAASRRKAEAEAELAGVEEKAAEILGAHV